VPETCELGNATSGHIKIGVLLDQLSDNRLLKNSSPWS
jgi:hypothetical protein